MAKVVHLIAIGKLKDQQMAAIEGHYLKQIKSPELLIHELKPSSENPDKEAETVVKKISDLTPGTQPFVILLTEWGKLFNSQDFSRWLYEKIERPAPVIFVLGGVQGHGSAVLKLPHEKISLSPLTFPHMLARILFVEQYYRAQTIKRDHPYHY